MPSTIQLYNHTVNRFNNGLNSSADTYKVMLLNDSASFNATHTTLTQVSNASAYEVSGNGWDVGGEALANVTIAVADTDGGKFDADNLSVAISGGTLGPYYKYVIYNDTDADDPPVAFVTMETALSVTSGNNAGIEWNANGIIAWTVA